MENRITKEELEQAAQPLAELLRKKGHPHMTAIVSDDHAEISEGIVCVRFPYEDENCAYRRKGVDMFTITSEMLDERIETLVECLGSLYAGGEALREEFYESV